MDLRTLEPVTTPPLGAPRPGRGLLIVFLLGVAVGGTIALAAVAQLDPGRAPPPRVAGEPRIPVDPPASEPSSELPGTYAGEPEPEPKDFEGVRAPPPPAVVPEHDPPEPPLGRPYDPLHPNQDIYELPPGPGLFSHAGMAFRFPEEWELVPTGGYHGLVGNTLWVTAIGVTERDHAMIQAAYWPWKYSDRQMKRRARDVTKGIAEVERGHLLTQPRAFRTAGITVHWLDFVSETSTGDSVTRAFHFTWNDTVYYVACKQSLAGDAPIIAGCDDIFSTLELGVY